MLPDYHMHPRSLGDDGVEQIDHTIGAIERYADAAARCGIDEIGLSEHVYYFTQTRTLWDVPYHVERCAYDIEIYVEAVLEAKQRGLPVKLGLEVDYVPGREEATRALLAVYPWDYLLGSVHFVDGHGIDGPPRLIDEVGVARAWEVYFEILGRAASSGLFDALAHPDLVKIWGDVPSDEVVARLQLAFVGALAQTGVAIEVSSAGLHRPVGELYPDARLLSLARDAGVPITLASDAHVAEHVGRDLGRAVAHARAAGYETVSVFETRNPRQEPLP